MKTQQSLTHLILMFVGLCAAERVNTEILNSKIPIQSSLNEVDSQIYQNDSDYEFNHPSTVKSEVDVVMTDRPNLAIAGFDPDLQRTHDEKTAPNEHDVPKATETSRSPLEEENTQSEEASRLSAATSQTVEKFEDKSSFDVHSIIEESKNINNNKEPELIIEPKTIIVTNLTTFGHIDDAISNGEKAGSTEIRHEKFSVAEEDLNQRTVVNTEPNDQVSSILPSDNCSDVKDMLTFKLRLDVDHKIQNRSDVKLEHLKSAEKYMEIQINGRLNYLNQSKKLRRDIQKLIKKFYMKLFKERSNNCKIKNQSSEESSNDSSEEQKHNGSSRRGSRTILREKLHSHH